MSGRRAQLLAVGLLLALLATGCGVLPTDVINGRPAVTGQSGSVGVYLIADGQVALAIRPTKTPSPSSPPPAEVLAMLAQGPSDAERRVGLTSEVPAGVTPATVGPTTDGLTVRLTGAVRSLSPLAVDQIVCTAVDAATAAGQGQFFVPVTLVGPDGTRPAQACPLA
ncbi:hypothetical protein ACFY2Q_19565 [Micromonospora sp. NPDC000316]|uniref:hypothetical protein n=1 Tax=Micromonospora sp. NPDC000316 TaxID=3364216 RepID=UPI00368ADC76